jgi:diguanylate cyclase (GGDEF)-like protein
VVLVADDSDVERARAREALAAVGYRVVEALDGQQALELYGRERPDIVLLDVVMPRLSGLETCRILKAKTAPSYVPVILLSTRNSVNARVEGLRSGADDYLGKPYDPEELRARVEALLRTRRLLDLRMGASAPAAATGGAASVGARGRAEPPPSPAASGRTVEPSDRDGREPSQVREREPFGARARAPFPEPAAAEPTIGSTLPSLAGSAASPPGARPLASAGPPAADVHVRPSAALAAGRDLSVVPREHDDSSAHAALRGGAGERLRAPAAFVRRLEEEFERAERYSDPLACLVVEIDGFDKLARAHGPGELQGAVLDVRDVLQDCVRKIDQVQRASDRSFVVLLPNTHFPGALSVAERIARDVRRMRLAIDPGWRASVSIGVSFYPNKDTHAPRQMLELVEAALDRARSEGGGRICLFQHQGYLYEPEP